MAGFHSAAVIQNMPVEIGQREIRHTTRILHYSMQVVALFSAGHTFPSLELGDHMGVGCEGDPVFLQQPVPFVATHIRRYR
jgi:hypothetical protein